MGCRLCAAAETSTLDHDDLVEKRKPPPVASAPTVEQNAHAVTGAGGSALAHQGSVGSAFAHQPSITRCETELVWLDFIVTHYWEEIRAFTNKSVARNIENALVNKLPGCLESSVDFRLGEGAPKFGTISASRRPMGRMQVVASVEWNSEITLDIKLRHPKTGATVDLGCKNLQLTGSVTAVPELHSLDPFSLHLLLYFVDLPEINLDFNKAAGFLDAPMLKGSLRQSVDDFIEGCFVLPNCLTIPVGKPPEDPARIPIPQPVGMVRFKLRGAEGFASGDWFTFSKADGNHYVRMSLGSRSHRSKSFASGDVFSFAVYDINQKLRIDVYDHDTLSSDDRLATTTLRVQDALSVNGHPVKLGSGSLELEGEWFAASSSMGADQKALRPSVSKLDHNHVGMLAMEVMGITLPKSFGNIAALLARCKEDEVMTHFEHRQEEKLEVAVRGRLHHVLESTNLETIVVDLVVKGAGGTELAKKSLPVSTLIKTKGSVVLAKGIEVKLSATLCKFTRSQMIITDWDRDQEASEKGEGAPKKGEETK